MRTNIERTFMNSHLSLPFLPYARSKTRASAFVFPVFAASILRKSWITTVTAQVHRGMKHECSTFDTLLNFRSRRPVRLLVLKIARMSSETFSRKNWLNDGSVIGKEPMQATNRRYRWGRCRIWRRYVL
jgi:hypothetical protein